MNRDYATKNTTAQQPKTKTHNRLRFLLAFAMMAIVNGALAQDQDYDPQSNIDRPFPTRPAESVVNALPEWNFETANGSEGGYKISSPKTIAWRIVLTGDLTLYPVANENGQVVLTRGILNEDWLINTAAVNTNNYTLAIIGNDENKLIFDGGSNNLTHTNAGFPDPQRYSDEQWGGGIYVWGGDSQLFLDNVIFEKFSNRASPKYSCGVISFENKNTSQADYRVQYAGMRNVEIRYCFGGKQDIIQGFSHEAYIYGRVIDIAFGIVNIYMENVYIHDCLIHEDATNGWYFNVNKDPISGMGGVIRSQGNTGGTLEMVNCRFHDNQYRDLTGNTAQEYYNGTVLVKDKPLSGQGGAINWRSGRRFNNGTGPEPELIIRNCEFLRNYAKEGGAIATSGKTTIKKDGTSRFTYISKNFAEYGGGLFFWPYNDGQPTFDGDGFNVQLGGGGFNDNNAYIRVFDNHASQSGGGVYMVIDPTDDVGFDVSNEPKNTSYIATFGTGCEIRGNRAPQGAGVSIIDNAAKRHRGYREKVPPYYGNQNIDNPVKDKMSGILSRTITFDGAWVKENHTSKVGDFPDEAAGAGIYIVKRKSTDTRFAQDFDKNNYSGDDLQDAGGVMTVDVLSGDISDNHARQYSLAIGNLYQDLISPFTDTEVTTNPKPGKGGGLYIASLYDITNFPSLLNVNIGASGKSPEIYENDAHTDGGGFYIYYDRVNGENGGAVTVNNGAIGKTNLNTGNKALTGNGGGLCVLGGTVKVSGGKVEYNQAAELGGGLYVNVPNKASVTYINADARNGAPSISFNEAKGGGGAYVDEGQLETNGPEFSEGAYKPATDAAHTRITKNKATAGNGGGIDAGNGTVRITNTLIYKNEAQGSGSTGRGGGLYLDGGTIDIVTSKILENTADLNGGGIDDHAGDISIKGGEISDNQARTGGGGGVYTHDGDITVVPDYDITSEITAAQENQVMAKGTKVERNKAGKNGGGLNTHTGRLDVRFATIKENEAGFDYGTVGTSGGNGGGIFCEAPNDDPTNYYTVRLLHCDLEENKAYGNVVENSDDSKLTGRGGGIYLKKGNIFAEHCDIIKNIADINGGGLDNHNGELRVYGSYIDENKALTGRGGGIYTEEGNIVVGPCDSYGFTESKASRITKNTAYINGGGINNRHGDITIHGDRINENTATTGDGGGVYINSGQINMYGGQINDNHADNGKGGGVYGGGGTFNIMERDANPILEILSLDKIKTDTFVVHFHHVDRGYAMEAGATGKEFGIAYSTNQYPDIPGDEEWTPENWSDVTKIEFSVADGASDTITTTYPSERYTYIRNEGCSRVIVTRNGSSTPATPVVAGATYYVVAYGKYTYGEKTYFDVSPALKITIPSGSKTAQGPRSVYPAVEGNPFFEALTPLQQALLAGTPEGDSTTLRTGKDRADDTPVNIPQINGNTAVYGGGICIDKQGANLIFAGSRAANPAELGQINKNYASEAGGGIYIGYQTEGENPGPAKMQMMGKCEVNYNRVPSGKHGGGIYLDGRFYVGDKDIDPQGTHGLKVDRNFAVTKENATFLSDIADIYGNPPTAALVDEYEKAVNNVFLPRTDYDYNEHDDAATTNTYNKISVITLLSDISGYSSGTTPYSHIGFSVLNGFCPVIATAKSFEDDPTTSETVESDYNVHDGWTGASENGTEEWLYQLMGMATSDGETAEFMTGAVFEDSKSYVAVHTRRDMAPFREKYIYLWGCWTHPIVKTDPEKLYPMKGSDNPDNPSADSRWLGHYVIRGGDNNEDGTGAPLEWDIYSPQGLAWFTAYVNGLNAFDEAGTSDGTHHPWKKGKNPKAVAKIMNDLDMSAYLWVPIGSVQKFFESALTEEGSLFVDSETQVMKQIHNPDYDDDSTQPESIYVNDDGYTMSKHYFDGEFDGQGHIIKGLQGLYLTGIKKFGLFGYLAENAVVKNTFVDEGLFVSDADEVVYCAGGIAGEMKNGSLSNSEARMNFNATYSAANTCVGGLVGNMKGGNIHSSMAMPSITTSTSQTGQFMGGLVGKMASGTSLKNSFANVEFLTVPAFTVGGIVGENQGTVENVYVRYNNADNTPKYGDTQFGNDIFYWIAGENGGTIKYCFTPEGKTGDGTNKWFYCNTTPATLRREYAPTQLVDGKYGFAQKDQEVKTFGGDGNTYIPEKSGLTYDKTTHTSSLNGLEGALNNWVAANSGYTKWTRTMASPINGDYPVLMFDDFKVVGSEDGIYMKYDDNVNDMWKQPNYESLTLADRTGKDFQSINTAENKGKAAMYLYKPNDVAISVSGNTYVPLHIPEDIGVLQSDGANLTARVGVTFDNSDGTVANGGKRYDWHMFSSALQAAPVGITYQSSNTNAAEGGKDYSVYNDYATLKASGMAHADWANRDYIDPPVITWNTADGTVGYFPTNTPYGQWGKSGHWPSSGDFSGSDFSFDFYSFHEQSRHWINFKREGTADFMDHWHEDIDATGKHQNLEYHNEETLQVGKGYMMGVSKVSMLMADGVLNNGEFTSGEALSNTEYSFNISGYSEELRGLNLVGNPYQSYLDFDQLVTENGDKIYGSAYYLFDADAGRYLCYPADASANPVNAPRYLHPHQGFFVKTASNDSTLTFKNTMRKREGENDSYFRGERTDYPLVNLFCYDSDGFYDVTTVEMNRPEQGGGAKLKDMRNGNSLLYARMDGEDYQTLFAPEGTQNVAVRFQASANGVYTMRWDMLHGNFGYLHLIDNIAGSDIDCLRQNEYRFEAAASDYASRFKLVFDVVGIDEQQAGDEQSNFAFQLGDELVVNGEGELSVFDVQGRCVMSRSLKGGQNSLGMAGVASGLYILRLAGDKQVKIQKMIVK